MLATDQIPAHADNSPRLDPLKEFVALVQRMDTETLSNKRVFLSCESVFKDNFWQLKKMVPGLRDKNAYSFDFSLLKDHPKLLFQTKVIVYLWLNFEDRTKIPSKATRYGKFKSALNFLIEQRAECLSELQQPMLLNEYFEQLAAAKQSFDTIHQKLIALKKASHFDTLLPFQVGHSDLPLQETLRRVRHKRKQQTLVIPPRLMTCIYSKSVALIEEAFSVKDELSSIKQQELTIYNDAKEKIEKKIESGTWKWLQPSKFTSKTAHQKTVTQEISREARVGRKKLYESAIKQLSIRRFNINSYADWLEYKRQLMNASLLVTQAFSGMRSSELLSIEIGDWFSTERDGETIYKVFADSYKFIAGGVKKVTFVVAPVVFSALELAKTLTESERSTLKYNELPYQSHLWLSQNKLSRVPVPVRNRGLNSRYNNLVRHINAEIEPGDLEELNIVNPGASMKLSVGQLWHITSHQLRRTMAVYLRRHDLASAHDIMYQYKHLSLTMALHYTNGATDAALNNYKPPTKVPEEDVIAYWEAKTFSSQSTLEESAKLLGHEPSWSLITNCMHARACDSGILSPSTLSKELKHWAHERLQAIRQQRDKADTDALNQHLIQIENVLMKLLAEKE